jgi:hypothetical protein
MAERIPEPPESVTARASICRRLARLGGLLRVRAHEDGGSYGAPSHLLAMSARAHQPDHVSAQRPPVSTADFAAALEALERWCVENGHERRVLASRGPDWSTMRVGDYPDGVDVVLLPVDPT